MYRRPWGTPVSLGGGGGRMRLQKGNFQANFEPKIAVFKPTIQVIQTSLVAVGRCPPEGTPGAARDGAARRWGVGWLLTRGRRIGHISEITPTASVILEQKTTNNTGAQLDTPYQKNRGKALEHI